MESPSLSDSTVPGLDPIASRRWLSRVASESPWLHEEVALRMVDRLQWIRHKPRTWVHWQPLEGGLKAQQKLQALYPDANCLLDGPGSKQALTLLQANTSVWRRWFRNEGRLGLAPAGETAAQMLWANMSLHLDAHPLRALQQWRERLEVGGFLMFSCLGPDTLIEVRDLYARHGWPEPAHRFTDMHDWGDMLIEAGFAEPIMDMERLTLTYPTAQSLLEECRSSGRNLSADRFSGLRGKIWQSRLVQSLQAELPRSSDGRLQVTVEVVYGHAFKPMPKVKVAASSAVSMQDMRAMLRTARNSADSTGKS